MNETWYTIHGFMIQRRKIQMILNYRNPKLVSRKQQLRMIIATKGWDYWERQCEIFGDAPTAKLKAELRQIDEDIELNLNKLSWAY
ncbi:hypothetical protein [Mucilaginibacter sp.]|uniref:hypothetical protein n=1 Tax=Mucilaginibacter sp. TaxID=1882438 RepID=UPI0025F9470A|nr:hypothetical protein [Mucilaginibacter sp.]